MAEMSPGAALRELRGAHSGLKKVRQLMRQTRENPALVPAVLDAGWESLLQAHRTMASIPRTAVDGTVMTQQLSLQRYATSLLVRLRRIARRDELGSDEDDSQDLEDAFD